MALDTADGVVEARAPDGLRVKGIEALVTLVQDGHGIDEAHSRLVDQAIAVWAKPGFDTLASLPRLRFEPFAYQLETAREVLRDMRGRAILADEVGLGKTIEAGITLSELLVRGLAARVLVIAPAGLVQQWREELDRKFGLQSVIYGSAEHRAIEDGQGITIVSLPTARRAEASLELGRVAWDMVIVDEAHHLRHSHSASARLVKNLQSRYLLLLTATPVQGRLQDLFQLVNLVRPGHLGTTAQFKARHRLSEGGGHLSGLALLQAQIRQVMVRHRRSEVAVSLPRRLAETIRVTPTEAEAKLYREVSDRVRNAHRGNSAIGLLALRSVQRMAGSSPAAVAATLAKLGWDDLAMAARGVGEPAKMRVLRDLLRRHVQRGEKVLVFSAFTRTVQELAANLEDPELRIATYHGGLAREAKDAAVKAFADDAPVMLSTEAAGEGRNLQFCHVMINYDLPWNPMEIEQRLGRIHRIGQRHDVVLTNLVYSGTIEDIILRVLETRINFFELVIGELDMILGNVTDELDFEAEVFQAHLQSGDMEGFSERMEELGGALEQARSSYLVDRARTDDLLPDPGSA
ncbi:MAG: DEAD/DEAH box helicase [Candidatus Dormibacteria bacterium]